MGGIGYNTIIYKRYKDDINYVLDIGEYEEEDIEHRRNAVAQIKTIAEEVDGRHLEVTSDATFEHEDQRQPMLDIKIWIGETEDHGMKILHTHHMKDVSSKALINVNSAHMMKI